MSELTFIHYFVTSDGKEKTHMSEVTKMHGVNPDTLVIISGKHLVI